MQRAFFLADRTYIYDQFYNALFVFQQQSQLQHCITVLVADLTRGELEQFASAIFIMVFCWEALCLRQIGCSVFDSADKSAFAVSAQVCRYVLVYRLWSLYQTVDPAICLEQKWTLISVTYGLIFVFQRC